MSAEFRIESDSMGDMKVPAKAYYGAQTARAAANFPISGMRFPRQFIYALGLIKKHAAIANRDLRLIPAETAVAIAKAAQEVADGKLDAHFVIDVFQTGSGTSTNMNANEVIANRAMELLEGKRGQKTIHPNDHVNRGQSSNDVIPTAIHLAALQGLESRLIPALENLHAELEAKTATFRNVIKIGRTHLQDATPIRLGQEFSGYACQVENGIARLRAAEAYLSELAIGGTAVGNGINTHPEFAARVIHGLIDETHLKLCEASNHFEAQGARDACVALSGALKTVAASLIKIANDIRLLGSGPRCGIGELKLPAVQPGSSIMPGKVNPVMCEMVIQVGAQIIGSDAAITFAGAFGNLELNAMMPVLAHNLFQSIELLANAASAFAGRCVAGLEADIDRCHANAERSLALCTALAPIIGYDLAARISKTAYESGKTIREAAAEMSGLSQEQLDELLDPLGQAQENRKEKN